VTETERLLPSAMARTLGVATQRLVEATHPDKVILFGSYARGDFHPRSDVDLLVVVPRVEDHMEEMARLRLLIADLPVALDLVVMDRAEVTERAHLRGTMLYHALREGRVLYAAA